MSKSLSISVCKSSIFVVLNINIRVIDKASLNFTRCMILFLRRLTSIVGGLQPFLLPVNLVQQALSAIGCNVQ